MLRKFRIPEIVLGALLATAVFAAVLSLSSFNSHSTGQNVAGNRADKSKNDSLGESIWDWVTHDAAGFFTLWLVLIGCAQIGLFYWQLRLISYSLTETKAASAAAKDAIILARDEYISSHRPEMRIHSIRLLPFVSETPPDDQPLCAEFGLINAGTSAGIVTGSAVCLEYRYEIDRPFPSRLPRNDVIRPRRYGVGATDSIRVFSDRYGGLNHVGRMDTGKILYLSGWLVYEDGTGNTRTTYFCHQYDADRERFTRVDDPDCNCTY